LGGRQTKGKEVRATRAEEQEKNKMRSPQREPEAGRELTWDQTGGGQTGPGGCNSFFRSGQERRDRTGASNLGQGGHREAATWACWASSEAGGR
jgi:hypothetical protein